MDTNTLRAELVKQLTTVVDEIAWCGGTGHTNTDALGTLIVNLHHAARLGNRLRMAIDPRCSEV